MFDIDKLKDIPQLLLVFFVNIRWGWGMEWGKGWGRGVGKWGSGEGGTILLLNMSIKQNRLEYEIQRDDFVT